jgi:membrane associated rhomboid family serine protease
MRIWTLLTGGFAETSLIFLVVNLVALGFAGGQFEPLWGNIEYGKFIVVVNMSTCLGAAMTYIFAYACSAERIDLLFFQFGGFWGVLAGFSVAFKQLFPQRRFTVPVLGLHGALCFF